MEYSFDDILALLKPSKDYDQLRGKCRLLWNSFSLETRQSLYCRIEEKKKRKEFVDYNPLWAIEKNSAPTKPQVLSFNEYYVKFGTTEEQGGWRKIYQPEQQRTIYVLSEKNA